MKLVKDYKLSLLVTPVLFIAGTLIFAAFPRNTGTILSLSFAGLVLVAGVIAYNIRKPGDIRSEFGLDPISLGKLPLFFAGLFGGVLFATMYRKDLGLHQFPAGLSGFAFTAAAIGFTEELLFRGFLQTRTRKISIALSIVIATSSHTAYKVMLFASLGPLPDVNLLYLAFWTFIVGLFFGILKEWSGSTLTPAAGHVAFDILAYGDRTQIPWWIWA